MHSYRVILRTYSSLDSISTGPDDLNTLACQSAGTNDAPRDLLHGPVTRNCDWHGHNYVYDYGYIYGYVYSPIWHHDCHEKQTLYSYYKSPPIVASYRLTQAPSSALVVLHCLLVQIYFWLKVFNEVWFSFPDPIQLSVFDMIWLRIFIFNLTHV